MSLAAPMLCYEFQEVLYQILEMYNPLPEKYWDTLSGPFFGYRPFTREEAHIIASELMKYGVPSTAIQVLSIGQNNTVLVKNHTHDYAYSTCECHRA